VVVVTLDEMWQFVKKTEKLWLWEPMTLLLGEPSPGFLVAVMTPHANISSTKLTSKARPSSPMIGRLSPPHSGEPTLHRQRPDRPHRTGQQQHSSFSRAVPSPHEGGLQGRGNGGFVAEDLPPPSTTISTPSPQKPQFCSLSLIRTLHYFYRERAEHRLVSSFRSYLRRQKRARIRSGLWCRLFMASAVLAAALD
jgi:hypothetical protein